MRLLLDTHVLLATIEQRTNRFPLPVRRLIADPLSEFHVSVASLWEIAIKWRLGKLHLAPGLHTLPDLIRDMGIRLLAIDEHHVLAAAQPEPLTRDPFDRLLLAQCQVEGLRLVTVDRALVSHAMAARPGH
ncbi:MAG: type II toxin-antitoxin system VapC family toxin [Acetobacteraceae bacterium]|nr:type II toxin-antitoxin system VapC family toxin [Acetobacteraceae bacterium]